MFTVFLELFLLSTFLLVPLFCSLSSNILQPSTYFPMSLVIPGYQWFLITNYVVFYHPACLAVSTLWYNQIIFTLNSLFFGTYKFSSFNTNSHSTCHSLPLNVFTSVFFISSTTLIISLSFLLAIFTFSSISILGPSITTSAKPQIHFSLINV